MSRACPAGRGDDGFVLVMTILIVMAIALGLAVFSEWVNGATQRAFELRRRVEAERHIAEARADVLYWFGTQLMSPRGVELTALGNASAAPMSESERVTALLAGGGTQRGTSFLRLDDTAYRNSVGTSIRLQDSRGLLNLNFAEPDDLVRLLGTFDVEAGARAAMVPKLLDYIDTDDLVRLNGAERQQYAAEGRPAPANGLLRTPWEARAVLGWDRYDRLWRVRDGLPQVTSATRTVGINVNSAPGPVLEALGVPAENVAKLLQQRAVRPFENIGEMTALMGAVAAVDPFRFLINPTNSFRMTLQADGVPLVREMVVTLTPQSTRGPWRIDYAIALPSSGAHAGDQPSASEPFPEPAALLPPP